MAMGYQWTTTGWTSCICTTVTRPVCTESPRLPPCILQYSRVTLWQTYPLLYQTVCLYLCKLATTLISRRNRTLTYLEISEPHSPPRIWCLPDLHRCPQKTDPPSLPKAKATKSWKTLTNVCILKNNIIFCGGNVFKMSGLIEADQESLVAQGVLRNLLLSFKIRDLYHQYR